MGFSVITAMVALYLDRGKRALKKGLATLTSAAIALLVLSACTPQTEAIRVGEDECTYCRMSISDARYGGELVTNKGKVYKFDSIECLAAHMEAGKKGSDDVHSLWVIDYNNPGQFVNVEKAWIVHSPQLRSPMGMNLTATSGNADAAQLAQNDSAEILRWQATKNLVRSEWLTPQANKGNNKCGGKCGH